MMDTCYCVKCKKQAKNLNSKGFVTKNNKYLVKSLCNICLQKITLFFLILKFFFENFLNVSPFSCQTKPCPLYIVLRFLTYFNEKRELSYTYDVN